MSEIQHEEAQMASAEKDDGFAPLRSAAPRGMPDAEAKLFRRTIDACPVGWFKVVDQPTLVQYVQLLTRIDKAQAVVAALPSSIVDTSHGPQVHPAVKDHDRLLRRAAELRAKLRLDPASRIASQQATLQRMTALGKHRAEREQGAAAQAEGSDAAIAAARARNSLLFGGTRAAAALRVDADD